MADRSSVSVAHRHVPTNILGRVAQAEECRSRQAQAFGLSGSGTGSDRDRAAVWTIESVGAVLGVQVGSMAILRAERDRGAAAQSQLVFGMDAGILANKNVAHIGHPVDGAVTLNQAESRFNVGGAGAKPFGLAARGQLHAYHADYPRRSAAAGD